MADINLNNSWLNFFTPNELLSASKLNEGFGILGSNINTLKNTITQFPTNSEVDIKIEEKTKGFLLLDPRTTIDSSTGLLSNDGYDIQDVLGSINLEKELNANTVTGQQISATNLIAQTANFKTIESDSSIDVNAAVLYKNGAYEETLIPEKKYLTKAEVESLVKVANQISEFDPTRTYNKGDQCIEGTGFYVSLKDDNKGNVPSHNSDWWTEVGINFDGYYTKDHINQNFVPISALTQYQGGMHELSPLSNVVSGQAVATIQKFAYGKSNLIVTVGGVIQTLGKDYYEEIADTDGFSQSIVFMRDYDFTKTGALEFRYLPYGQVVSQLGIDDQISSPLSTYSSAKLDTLYDTLVKMVNANTALASSEWSLIKQINLEKKSNVGYRTTTGWVKLSTLGLDVYDIFPAKDEVIKIRPSRNVKIQTSEGCFENIIIDQNTTQVKLALTISELHNKYIIIDRDTGEFKVDSDNNIYFYQVLVYRSREVNTYSTDGSDPSLGVTNNSHIDDTNILADKTWSSQKIKNELDLKSDEISATEVQFDLKFNTLSGNVTQLKTYVDSQDVAFEQQANRYTDERINASTQAIKAQVVNEVSNVFVTKPELQTTIEPIQIKLDETKAIVDNPNIIPDKYFKGDVHFERYAFVERDPTNTLHATNKKYVDNSINDLNVDLSTRLGNVNTALTTSITDLTTDLNTKYTELKQADVDLGKRIDTLSNTTDIDNRFAELEAKDTELENQINTLVTENTNKHNELEAKDTDLENRVAFLENNPVKVDLSGYLTKGEAGALLAPKLDATTYQQDKQLLETSIQSKVDTTTYTSDKQALEASITQNRTELDAAIADNSTTDQAYADALVAPLITRVDAVEAQLPVDLSPYSTTAEVQTLIDTAKNDVLATHNTDKQALETAINDKLDTATYTTDKATFALKNNENTFNNLTINRTNNQLNKGEVLSIVGTRDDATYVAFYKESDNTTTANRKVVFGKAGSTADQYVLQGLNATPIHIMSDQNVEISSGSSNAIKLKSNTEFTSTATINDPTQDTHLANKRYVDIAVAGVNSTAEIGTLRNDLTALTTFVNQIKSGLVDYRPYEIVGNYDATQTYNRNQALIDTANNRVVVSLVDNNNHPMLAADVKEDSYWRVVGHTDKADTSNFPTRAEVSSWLSAKVDSTELSNYYTNLQVDSLLSNKLDTTTYNTDKQALETTIDSKLDVDTYNADKAELETQIDNKATFRTTSTTLELGEIAVQQEKKFYLNFHQNNGSYTNFVHLVGRLKSSASSVYSSYRDIWSIVAKPEQTGSPLCIVANVKDNSDLVLEPSGTGTVKIGGNNPTISAGTETLKLYSSNQIRLSNLITTGEGASYASILPDSNEIKEMRFVSGSSRGFNLVLGRKLTMGVGGTEVLIIPDDTSDKVIKFYDDSANKKFRLAVKEPTANEHVTNKKYVDELVANNINPNLAQVKITIPRDQWTTISKSNTSGRNTFITTATMSKANYNNLIGISDPDATTNNIHWTGCYLRKISNGCVINLIFTIPFGYIENNDSNLYVELTGTYRTSANVGPTYMNAYINSDADYELVFTGNRIS